VTTAYVPRLVMSRFMYRSLSTDPAVMAALGSTGVIVPDEAIPTNVVLTLAQTFSGGMTVAKPLHAPITQVGMYWDLTAWTPAYSREANEPLMIAAMNVLLGPQTQGKTHTWTDPKDNRPWAIDCDFSSEEPVALDIDTPQVWAPVRHRYRVALRSRQ
jgi:hypothetical protein